MEWRRTRKSGMEGIIELGETEFYIAAGAQDNYEDEL